MNLLVMVLSGLLRLLIIVVVNMGSNSWKQVNGEQFLFKLNKMFVVVVRIVMMIYVIMIIWFGLMLDKSVRFLLFENVCMDLLVLVLLRNQNSYVIKRMVIIMVRVCDVFSVRFLFRLDYCLKLCVLMMNCCLFEKLMFFILVRKWIRVFMMNMIFSDIIIIMIGIIFFW